MASRKPNQNVKGGSILLVDRTVLPPEETQTDTKNTLHAPFETIATPPPAMVPPRWSMLLPSLVRSTKKGSTPKGTVRDSLITCSQIHRTAPYQVYYVLPRWCGLWYASLVPAGIIFSNKTRHIYMYVVVRALAACTLLELLYMYPRDSASLSLPLFSSACRVRSTTKKLPQLSICLCRAACIYVSYCTFNHFLTYCTFNHPFFSRKKIQSKQIFYSLLISVVSTFLLHPPPPSLHIQPVGIYVQN